MSRVERSVLRVGDERVLQEETEVLGGVGAASLDPVAGSRGSSNAQIGRLLGVSHLEYAEACLKRCLKLPMVSS